MQFTKVLAVILVSDLERSLEWYGRFFDRPGDSRPMNSLADWHLTDSAWVQVFQDPERAGRSVVNFAVDSLDRSIEELRTRNISVGKVTVTSQNVKLATVSDPDGNAITLIENPST